MIFKVNRAVVLDIPASNVVENTLIEATGMIKVVYCFMGVRYEKICLPYTDIPRSSPSFSKQ